MDAPKIYNTDVPEKIIDAINSGTPVILSAPTGYGKSVLLVDIGSYYKGRTIMVIPNRPSVLALYEYTKDRFGRKVGYKMHADSTTAEYDDITLMVTGYFLEYITYNIKKIINGKLLLIIDEAHESSWQTDLLIRIAIWAARSNKELKLVFASATINTNIFDSLKDKVIIEADSEHKADTEINFCPLVYDENISPELKNVYTHISISKSNPTALYDELICSILINKLEGKNTLIILPGEEEIFRMIKYIEEHMGNFNLFVYPLYSKLTQEEIKQAINIVEGTWTIIVSTNIVQSAITIKKLHAVIDLCMRKEAFIDNDNTMSLKEVIASKSDLIQSAGRVGREGKTGNVYYIISEYKYLTLTEHSLTDVYRNPLYHQIIRLIKMGLPVYEIFDDINLHNKIDHNLDILHENGFIYKSDNELSVTENGNLFSNMQLSINNIQFILHSLKYLDPYVWYPAIIIACWVNLNGDVFYNPKRKFKESTEKYKERLEEIYEKQDKYKDPTEDSMCGILKIIRDNPSFDSAGLYDKNYFALKKSIKNVMHTLETMGYHILDDIKKLSIKYICSQLVIPLYNIYKKNLIRADTPGGVIKYDKHEEYDFMWNKKIPHIGLNIFKLKNGTVYSKLIRVVKPTLPYDLKIFLYEIYGVPQELWDIICDKIESPFDAITFINAFT
jgi:HrpA-like RNA helicase